MDAVELQVIEFKESLQAEAEAYRLTLSAETIQRLGEYYAVLTAWNSRLHLVSFRSPKEFSARHVLESLLMLKYLSQGARVVDVGSGGGLPIVPCLIARSDLQAVLVEASKKKAVFLREVLRETEIKDRANVIAERFEKVPTPEVDYVSCRALERFESMLPLLMKWAPAPSTLLLFGGEGLGKAIENLHPSSQRILLPNSARRFLFVIQKSGRALL